MKIQIDRILEYNITDNKERQNSNDVFGSLFKSYRNKNNLTLKQSSRSICSSSFLSKVENHLSSMPSEMIQKFCDKYELNEEDYLKPNANIDYLIDTILDCFLKEDIINIKPKEVLPKYYRLLIEYANNVYLNTQDRVISIYNELVEYLPVLSEKELNYFYLLTAIFLFNNLQTFKALLILRKIKTVNHDEVVSLLTNMYYLEAQILLNYQLNTLDISILLNKYMELKLSNLYDRLITLLSLYVIENNLTNNEFYKSFIINTHIYKVIKNLYFENFMKGLTLIKDYKDSNIYTASIYSVLNKLNNNVISFKSKHNYFVSEFAKFVKQVSTIDNDDNFYHNLKINYLNLDNYQNYYFFKFVAYYASLYFETKSKYKYAYLTLKEYNKLLNNLKREKIDK